jgi:lysophospholipase-2
MSRVFTERTNGVITVTNDPAYSALVVISHGLGDTAEGFVDVAEQLSSELPFIKFILPTAPVQAVTLNGGMRMNSWYDIVGLDERSNEFCEGIHESKAVLENILTSHKEELPYSRMVLAGFSQGAALSLFTGIQFHSKLAGIVCMSGYLPAASQVKVTDELADTPIWHGHGTQDMVVNFKMADKTKQALAEKGVKNYSLHSYAIGHTVSPQEIGDVLSFFKTVLPPDDTCRIPLQDPATMSVKQLKAAIRRAGIQSQAVGFYEKSEFIKLLQDQRSK